MIPLVYGFSTLHHHGVWQAFHFDDAQRLEILLTVLQTAVGVLLLSSMRFGWLDASMIFVLWLVQFLRAGLREEVAVAYILWMAILVVGFAIRAKPLLAPKYFWAVVRRRPGDLA